jgi:hypothetical protein
MLQEIVLDGSNGSDGSNKPQGLMFSSNNRPQNVPAGVPVDIPAAIVVPPRKEWGPIIAPFLEFEFNFEKNDCGCGVKNPTKGPLSIILYNMAIATAFGAGAGAIGFSVFQTAGWTVASINYINFVQAMALGGAVTSPIPGLLKGIGQEVENQTAKSILSNSYLLWILASGALLAMTGAGMQSLLNNGEEVGFAAAAGETGGVIMMVSSAIAIQIAFAIIMRCGVCCLDTMGQPKLLELPAPDNNETTDPENPRRSHALRM